MRITRAVKGLVGTVMIILLSGILIGCRGRYEIKEDKRGRMVRLDKWTGKIAILDDDRLVPVVKVTKQKTKSKEPKISILYISYDSSEECEKARKERLKEHPGAVCVREDNYSIQENGKKLR